MIIYMGRIFNALAYILRLYFLIRYFKYGKTALMFISLLPIMVQQASSLSYDVMNYLEVMLAIGLSRISPIRNDLPIVILFK